MVSAAEQLAANLNFSALAKAEELKKRIWFTLGALLVYRLGTYIPLPGIDPAAWDQIFQPQAGGILGMFNMFSGGGIHRMAIFALEHHAVHLRLDHHSADDHGVAHARKLKKEGEQGRKMINQYTRYLRSCSPRSRPMASPSGSKARAMWSPIPACSSASPP